MDGAEAYINTYTQINMSWVIFSEKAFQWLSHLWLIFIDNRLRKLNILLRESTNISPPPLQLKYLFQKVIWIHSRAIICLSNLQPLKELLTCTCKTWAVWTDSLLMLFDSSNTLYDLTGCLKPIWRQLRNKNFLLIKKCQVISTSKEQDLNKYECGHF